jgi:rod shape-determining protein MreD
MLDTVFLFMIGLFLLFIQSHPLLPFGKGGIRPDLILILVTYIGTQSEDEKGAILVFLLGCCFAVVSGSPAGLYPFIYLSVFILVRYLKRFFIFKNLQILLMLLIICCCIEGIILLVTYTVSHIFSLLFNLFLSLNLFILWSYHLLFS